ncbi:MAG: 4Fe-4S dicluster domain-containing protein [Chitinivibrionales bacterium]
MTQVALNTTNIKKLVVALLKEGVVRAPVETEDGVVLADITEKSAIAFDYANVKLPLKREFFPQCETISRFGLDGVVEEKTDAKKTVLFAVRPCDVQSIAYLDKVFIDDKYQDPYYQSRRDKTFIVALACSSPASTCFCESLGQGPARKSGSDVITYKLGDSFVLEAVSEKGEAFIKKNKNIFRAVMPKELQAVAKQEADAIKKMSAVTVNMGAIKQNNDPAIWDEVAETCLSCGACTFLCPTCHCFDLFDEKRGDGGKRIRVHDACMFELFTKEASGHNPRAQKGDRMRQRIMHKFSYAPDNYRLVFCVGCGRCIMNCPSNIDIRETLARVTA